MEDRVEDWRNGGFGVYVHWPFCQAKCPYCDFNSHVAAEIDQARWQRAYLTEIDRIGTEVPGRIVNSIFFGGGTPSLMAPALVASVIERIRRTWPAANDVEITLEANPTSVEADRFRAYRDAGVNRLSLGVQALDDKDLRRLGRRHSAVEALAAFEIARATFPRVSFDLIYARQHQTLAAWRDELSRALALAVDHLSLYQLTIEDGTPFAARRNRGGLHGLPDDDLAADMYALTTDLCATAGLDAYEVSNHAAPGAESRHNLIYWRCGDFAGIGPGAHGRLSLGPTRIATRSTPAPSAWLDAVDRHGNGDSGREILSPQDRGNEYLMMSLRLAEGTDPSRYRIIANRKINDYKALIDLGLLTETGHRLRATGPGRMILDSVIRELLA